MKKIPQAIMHCQIAMCMLVGASSMVMLIDFTLNDPVLRKEIWKIEEKAGKTPKHEK